MRFKGKYLTPDERKKLDEQKPLEEMAINEASRDKTSWRSCDKCNIVYTPEEKVFVRQTADGDAKFYCPNIITSGRFIKTKGHCLGKLLSGSESWYRENYQLEQL